MPEQTSKLITQNNIAEVEFLLCQHDVYAKPSYSVKFLGSAN